MKSQIKRFREKDLVKYSQKEEERSFLFSKGSHIRLDAIFNLLKNAINSLIIIDEELKKFFSIEQKKEYSIFQIDKSWEHLITEEFEELKKRLNILIYLLSKHFLTRSCQEIIEFLLRRYPAEIVLEPLLLSALPFHGTVPFTKLIVYSRKYIKEKSHPLNWMIIIESRKNISLLYVLPKYIESNPKWIGCWVFLCTLFVEYYESKIINKNYIFLNNLLMIEMSNYIKKKRKINNNIITINEDDKFICLLLMFLSIWKYDSKNNNSNIIKNTLFKKILTSITFMNNQVIIYKFFNFFFNYLHEDNENENFNELIYNLISNYFFDHQKIENKFVFVEFFMNLNFKYIIGK